MTKRWIVRLGFVAVAVVALVPQIVPLAQQRAGTAGTRADAPPPGQTATLLPDGRWLLVGGEGAEQTAMVWNPLTATSTAGSLASPRAWHTATVLPDGRVLIAGGRSEGAPVAGIEIFDPSTETFAPFALAGAMPRAEHTATLLTDGRILVTGGTDGTPLALPSEIWTIESATPSAALLSAVGRLGHSATLLPDGRVLIAGGRALDASNVSAAIIDPVSLTILSATAPGLDQPFAVAASSPANGAFDVPIDVRLALRFSAPVAGSRAGADLLPLTGPRGRVPARIVFAEQQRLAFVWPLQPLDEGTTYELTVSELTDARGVPIAPTIISFTTVEARTEQSAPPDTERWVPDATSRTNGWRTDRPPSPWESLPPLLAPPGVTAISGRVLTLDGRPLAGVTLEVEDEGSTESDRTGRFLLVLKTATTARRVVEINAMTASGPGRRYGCYEYGLTVQGGITTVLPFTIWQAKLDTAHQVTIPSPTTSEVVITTPYIPGLELHIPPGTVIRDEEGKAVTTLGITPIPVDRPPFPLARNVTVPVYFTIQPGGAYVHTHEADPKGAWLVYPNYAQEYVGKRVQFFHYDPAIKGWYVYGLGTVNGNGTQVLPDARTRIYEFTGAMINSGSSPPDDGPPPGDCCGTDGDPVNLATGLFTLDATDLYLPDVIPLALTRTYRSRDPEGRPFGPGTTHPYAMFLWSANQYQEADLILPDGGKIHFVRTSPGNGVTDAVFVHQETPTTSATPTAFYKAHMTWNGNGWDVRLIDGTVYVFGENAPLQAIRDRHGNTVTIAHANGQSGNITQVTSPNGRWIQFTYSPSNRITQAKDNVGRTVTYTYDTNGNLATVTDPENHVTSYTYDDSHRMLTVKPPNLQGTQNHLVTNEYTTSADTPTPVGWVKKQTHVDGGVYQFAYTFVNGAISQTLVTDPRGKKRRLTFNSDHYTVADRRAVDEPEEQGDTSERPSRNNFVTSWTNPHGDVTQTDYDGLGRVTRVVRRPGTADEAITTYAYDPVWVSEMQTITDPLNHTTTFGYDTRGNRTSIADALNHTTTFAHNAGGQVTSVTDPLQHTTTFDYANADLVTITDPLGRATRRFFDAAGRLLSQTDAAGQTTRFAYDRVNHPTQIIDPLGGVTAYGYDPAGRLTTITDALNHTTTYGYDGFNRLASRTDPLSKPETFAYDLAGHASEHVDRKDQLTTRTYDGLNRLQQITYADTSTIAYTYDSGNRLRTIADSLNGTITREYDNLDRLTSETTAQGTISYTYDKADRRTTMTVTGQPMVEYGYDAANRLTSVTQGTSVVTITYDDADRRSTLTLPNGIVTTYSYDNANQLTSLTYTLGQTTLGTLTYTYDLAGRRTEVGGTWARTGLPQALTSASYDAANRLVAWNGQVFSYDLNGNLASDGLTSYAWNARNQLVGLSGSTSASFAYDAFARRRSKSIGVATTQFVYDGLNFIHELNGGGTPTANLLTGVALDETFTRTDSGGASTPLVDALGSPLELADATGMLQTHYTFDPFGGTTASGAASSNTQQFTGRENDGSGLYFYRARYYHSQLQRFIAEDPLGFGGGGNVHAYVDNRPADLVDPSGLSAYLYCEQIPSTRGGGLVGAAALALTAARHCYVRVICPGKYDVTFELYGPQPGAPNGRPMMGVPNPARNANATVSPIYPREPNPDGCCNFENELIKQFNLRQPPPPYNPQGPNSNTFVADIIRAAGGLAVFPASAIGADYNNR